MNSDEQRAMSDESPFYLPGQYALKVMRTRLADRRFVGEVRAGMFIAAASKYTVMDGQPPAVMRTFNRAEADKWAAELGLQVVGSVVSVDELAERMNCQLDGVESGAPPADQGVRKGAAQPPFAPAPESGT